MKGFLEKALGKLLQEFGIVSHIITQEEGKKKTFETLVIIYAVISWEISGVSFEEILEELEIDNSNPCSTSKKHRWKYILNQGFSKP